MRCCASPTISTAEATLLPLVSRKAHPDAERDGAVAFTALLTSIALRPLAKPLGFYGDIVIDACALGMARAMPQKALPGFEP